MNRLRKEDGRPPGPICDWPFHNHRSYDAVAHGFDNFFLDRPRAGGTSLLGQCLEASGG